MLNVQHLRNDEPLKYEWSWSHLHACIEVVKAHHPGESWGSHYETVIEQPSTKTLDDGTVMNFEVGDKIRMWR